MSEAFQRSIKPPDDCPISEWGAKHVRLQNSERATHFDIEQTPFWRRPLEAARDNEIKEIVVMAPTGSGKSTLAETIIPWVVSEDPGPFLYASQTDADAKFWAESRLLPTLKSCASIRRLWPEDRHQSRKMEIIFPHMPLVLGGANISNFQEKSCRYLYGDEVWEWKRGLVREFLGRHHNRWNRKVWLVSQAGEVDDELHAEFKKTDMAEFSWTCTKCDATQAYRGKQCIVDDVKVDGKLDIQSTAKTARLRCDNCGEEYQDTVKVRRELCSNGDYVSQQKGLDGYIGCHVHALALWWIPWSEYALERIYAFIELKKGISNKLKQLTQKRDAIPWSEDMGDGKIELKQGTYLASEYSSGQKPEGEAIRFMTVDVGGDHFWVVVRSWQKGGDSILLLNDSVERESDLIEIQNKYGVNPRHVFIDTGFKTEEIYDICAKNGWIGVKGSDSKSFKVKTKRGVIDQPYSEIKRTRSKSGKNALFVLIASDYFKDILMRLMTGKGANWEYPIDVSSRYKSQINSEKKVRFTNKTTGKDDYKYVKIKRDNHYLDCEYYQVAAAVMATLFSRD